MTILDAYAVLAFLKGEPAAAEVEQLILAGGVAMTVLGVAEVLDHLIRRCDANEEDATLDVAQLGLDAAVGLDVEVAAAAGRLRGRHYHRTSCPVSLADCVAAEAARSTQRPLATSDPSLFEVCHREGIGIVVLPGTDGSRWATGPRR